MRTVAATRQDLARVAKTPKAPKTTPTVPAVQADLKSGPKVLDWAVYIRQNVKLSKSARSLAFLLITLGQGQNITMSQANMAKAVGMRRDTVGDAIDELHRLGLIVVKGHGRNRTEVYRLTMPVQVVPVEDQLVVPVEDQLVDPQEDQLVVPVEDHNMKNLDQDRQEDLTSTSDDDVAAGTASPSGENRAKTARAKASTRTRATARAKDDSPAKKVIASVDEFVSDLEGCRDELARRLGVDPGRITVKPLAKTLRNIDIKHDKTAMWSDILDICPEDDLVWAMSAGKDNPVGFLKFALEQRLEGNEVTDNYRAPSDADDEPVVEIDTRVLADKIADRVLAGETVYYFQGSDYGVSQDAMIDAIKLMDGDDRFMVHHNPGSGGCVVSPAR
jgi:hypothetical protein